MLEHLKSASLPEVTGFFFLVNCVIFGASITLCKGLALAFRDKRIFAGWEPLRTVEVIAAVSSVFLNVVVSVFGWIFWTKGWISIVPSTPTKVVFDSLVMILAMDLGMYFFHRAAHFPLVFRLVHRFHHRHETTNPISLFVLHPLEVIGFGGLMIGFLLIYPMSLGGLLTYLTLNVIFGTLGHCGVEPFPPALRKIPILRLIGTSTFHAEHHEHQHTNFGFYTLIWDQLFGTLDPQYGKRFRQDD